MDRRAAQAEGVLSLPDDILTHVFTYLDPKDHLSLAAVCRRICRLYSSNRVWQRLAYQYFPHESRLREQFLALNDASGPVEHPRTPYCQSRSWKDLFVSCTNILTGLNEGCFTRTAVWEHAISSSPLLVDYQVFLLGNTHIFMERSVTFSGETRFLFRSLDSSNFHFEWKINPKTIFTNFNPLRNRIHCDIRMKDGLLMLAFYHTNGMLRHVYRWSVNSLLELKSLPQQALPSYWSSRDIAESAAKAIAKMDKSDGAPEGHGPEPEPEPAPPTSDAEGPPMKLLRLQPPFAALQSDDFLLVNIMTSEVVFRVEQTRGSIVACRWDSTRLIFVQNVSQTAQEVHIVTLKALAMGVSSGVERFSHPHLSSQDSNHICFECDHKLSGSYLDFFHCSTGIAIFASTVSRTFCKMLVRTQSSNTGPNSNRQVQQSLLRIETESMDAEGTFSSPKGLLFGNSGPFIAFSDGCDVFWFVDKGDSTQPTARKVRVGMGHRCTGHHQVVILGASLLHICSKHSEQVREVSLYEPCMTRDDCLRPLRFYLES
eukprot:c1999_g1_i1.p1 GENE.c1999_g1_i1~~c1999_g1_i1.p1  ORF type:complete len:542 (-),score=74.04 c1999_g1_i1:85-1710(-)